MPQMDIPDGYYPKPFIPTITFKDGSTIDARAGFNGTTGDLWIWPLVPMTFVEASSLFSDVFKTDYLIVKHSLAKTEEFEHYTKLTTIQQKYDGSFSIRLQRS